MAEPISSKDRIAQLAHRFHNLANIRIGEGPTRCVGQMVRLLSEETQGRTVEIGTEGLKNDARLKIPDQLNHRPGMLERIL